MRPPLVSRIISRNAITAPLLRDSAGGRRFRYTAAKFNDKLWAKKSRIYIYSRILQVSFPGVPFPATVMDPTRTIAPVNLALDQANCKKYCALPAASC